MTITQRLRVSASPRETVAAILFLFLCFSAFAERQPFERYQGVVDRQMFGPPPDGFDPTKRPDEVKGGREAQRAAQELTKEQEKLKSAIRFSMINVTPAGETAVGFTDSSDTKNPKNYYLKVGESRDGWTVKEADPVASSMTIVKGEIEVSLTIGGDSGKGAGKTASAAGAASRTASPGGGFGSLRARRNQRRAEENARMEAFDKQLKEREAAFEKRQQEERQAREEEKAQQEAQREEQRQQLLKIQEELKRAREDKEKAEKAEKEENASDT